MDDFPPGAASIIKLHAKLAGTPVEATLDTVCSLIGRLDVVLSSPLDWS